MNKNINKTYCKYIDRQMKREIDIDTHAYINLPYTPNEVRYYP